MNKLFYGMVKFGGCDTLYGYKTYLPCLAPEDVVIVQVGMDLKFATFCKYVEHFTMKKIYGDGRPPEDCPEMVQFIVAVVDPITVLALR